MIFHVAREGAGIGQFSEEEFRDKILTGNIKPGDHFWKEGMDDWQLVSEYRAPAVAERPADFATVTTNAGEEESAD